MLGFALGLSINAQLRMCTIKNYLSFISIMALFLIGSSLANAKTGCNKTFHLENQSTIVKTIRYTENDHKVHLETVDSKKYGNLEFECGKFSDKTRKVSNWSMKGAGPIKAFFETGNYKNTTPVSIRNTNEIPSRTLIKSEEAGHNIIIQDTASSSANSISVSCDSVGFIQLNIITADGKTSWSPVTNCTPNYETLVVDVKKRSVVFNDNAGNSAPIKDKSGGK